MPGGLREREIVVSRSPETRIPWGYLGSTMACLTGSEFYFGAKVS